MPDWWINRMLSFGSVLLSGLTLDWGWYGCALAWLIVAGGMMIWSLNENEARHDR